MCLRIQYSFLTLSCWKSSISEQVSEHSKLSHHLKHQSKEKHAKFGSDWTLFLDRDGVINRRNFDGYITSVDAFEFLPGAITGLREIAGYFGRIIIVTNQQGIAKGLMTRRNLAVIHRYMQETLEREGVRIDGIFVADNARGAKNDRRKPLPAMGLEAKTMFSEIDFDRAVMVGDTESDIEFGMNLGMKTVLVRSKEEVNVKPDWTVNDLKELANEWT